MKSEERNNYKLVIGGGVTMRVAGRQYYINLSGCLLEVVISRVSHTHTRC